MRARAIRAIAVAAAMSFVVAACGQKPGVHIEGGGLAAGEGGQGGTTLDANPGDGGGLAVGDTATGDTAGTAGGDTATGGTAGSTSGDTGGASGGASGGGTSGDSGGTTQGQSQGNQQQGTAQPQGSDTTGAPEDKIVFGLHAPVTGAAPLPTTSFEKSGDLYWRNFTERQKKSVLGRKKVELIFRDDRYSPDAARQVCRELAGKAFALAGGGGTDQIQACGELAARGSFPYFSAGVTEAGLVGNPWYFASSMSYRQQGLLLAQMVAKNPFKDNKIGGNGKIAAIITATRNFEDAKQGWEEGIAQFGLGNRYYKTYQHPKGDTNWYDAVARDFRDNKVEVVYILSSPVDYIDFAQTADDKYGYNPRYIGVGVSMGLNAVLGSGCTGGADARVDKGIFFSPFPALDWARKNVPEFFAAAKEFGVPNDDIALALWGSNAVTHQLLERYGQIFGNKLTREDFRAVVEQQTGVKTGVFPELNYSPDDHFGAGQVHVLQADCAKGEYVNRGVFKSQF